MFTIVPFLQLAAVGVVAHAIEHKLERSGHGSRVLYVKLGTYVVCAVIALYQWRDAFRQIGYVFNIHTL